MDESANGDGPSAKAALLDHAREFLKTPEVQVSSFESRRQFLRDKGLSPSEIDQLLAESLLSSPPPIPPRTYPQPAPSILPNLFAATARVATSLALVTSAATLAYQTFLLSRAERVVQARRSLKVKQVERLKRLEELSSELQFSINSLEIFVNPPGSRRISSLEDIPPTDGGVPAISLRNLVQAAINANEKGEMSPSQIASLIRERFPSLFGDNTEDEILRQIKDVLGRTALFSRQSNSNEDMQDEETYTLVETTAVNHSELSNSEDEFSRLRSYIQEKQTAMAQFPEQGSQHTLRSLTDLTSYLTTQTYEVPIKVIPAYGRVQRTLGAAEEEVRKEIRSLKGMVLNRRTFTSPTVEDGP